jgi:hypothetical protein
MCALYAAKRLFLAAVHTWPEPYFEASVSFFKIIRNPGKRSGMVTSAYVKSASVTCLMVGALHAAGQLF